MMSEQVLVKALHTIRMGIKTPDGAIKVAIEPGQEFPCSKDDSERLLRRSAVVLVVKEVNHFDDLLPEDEEKPVSKGKK
jgi:hypothetical protein